MGALPRLSALRTDVRGYGNQAKTVIWYCAYDSLLTLRYFWTCQPPCLKATI